MSAIIENMSTQGHLNEAMRLLEEAHNWRTAPGGHERAMTASAIAQTHLMMVQLRVDEGKLPALHPHQ